MPVVPKYWWGNWMIMENTLSDAKYIWPSAEWADLRCYVLREDHEAVVTEMKAKVEIYEKALEYFTDHSNYNIVNLGIGWNDKYEVQDYMSDRPMCELAREALRKGRGEE